MYCSSCGTEVSDTHRFCPQCGTPVGSRPFTSAVGRPARLLSRPRGDRKIAGVCSGFARYFGMDVTLVRILTLVLAIWPPGVGLIFYLVCWIVMPQDLLQLPAANPPAQTSEPGNLAVS